MRAICCAILAYSAWQVAYAIANGSRKNNAEFRYFIAGLFVLLSFVLAIASAFLCVVGL